MAGLVDPRIMSLDLGALRALMLDIDGVLYEGSRALPGAVELIGQLRREEVPFLLLSNNTFAPAVPDALVESTAAFLQAWRARR